MANFTAIVLAATLVAGAAAAATQTPHGIKFGAPGEPSDRGPLTPATYSLEIEVPEEVGAHRETIEIASLGWGATGALTGCAGQLGAGRAIIAGPGVVASDGLYRAVATQRPISTATLTARSTGGEAAVYAVTLTDVRVSPVMTSTTSPVEDLAIDFSAARFAAGGCSVR